MKSNFRELMENLIVYVETTKVRPQDSDLVLELRRAYKALEEDNDTDD